MDPWRGFRGEVWRTRVDVGDFVRDNYQPYFGGADLSEPSARTNRLWGKCLDLMARERDAGGVLEVDTRRVAGITAWAPGYIDREDELVVGCRPTSPLSAWSIPGAVGGWSKRPVRCGANPT